ncbi:nucleoside recognition domain-containing protein [Candidatus Merdisoma sp. HCP28S3_D10]|uniref:nucleoside recognition domain-containing protein n=1 Tax=unclassified Candidatus Merdisoma TaxID=3099611 RepID=UPI003F89FF6D
MKKKYSYLILCLILFAFMLLSPARAAAAASEGLLLWFHALIPVLLPFFILSRLLIVLDGVAFVTRLIEPFTGRLFGLSPNGSFCLLAGFLCGYPAGARISADLVRERRISPEEGTYLLTFTNNASPAFLTGYCLTESLGLPEQIPISLALVYGIPLLYALLTRRGRCFPSLSTEKKTSGSQISFKIVDACIMDGLENILKLGGYLILFSMLAKLLLFLFDLCPLLSCIGAGMLEMTNGIAVTAALPEIAPQTAWVLTLFYLSFGGLSGAAQTESMLQGTDLSLGSYLKAKTVTAATTLCLAFIYLLLTGRLPPFPRKAAL